MSCNNPDGKFRWFYTGNQVGNLNPTGDLNFVSGGPDGTSLASGTLVQIFFRDFFNRAIWESENATLDQNLLNAAYPTINLNWIADIELNNGQTIRFSNRNVYVQDSNGDPRFYPARSKAGPNLNVTGGDWLSANFEIGNIRFVLNNRDGFYNKYLPQGDDYTQWMNSKVTIKLGFGEKLSNYYEVYEGYIPKKQGIVTSHKELSINVYDKFEKDQKQIHSLFYDRNNFPNVDEQFTGKPLPLLYGDWSEEVGDYGEIPATCINALEVGNDKSFFKISSNSIEEVGDIYLHRGNRVVGQEGPIRLDPTYVTVDLKNSLFTINNDDPVLTEDYILFAGKRAGPGSGLNFIASPSSDVNFLTLGVKIGDIVYKEGSNTPSTVTNVTSGTLTLTGGVTFVDKESFSVVTVRYSFFEKDQLSVKCKGKNIALSFSYKLGELGLVDNNLFGLSYTIRNTFWTVDNENQKVYEMDLDKNIVRDIDFSSIDASISNISGITEQFDKSLWIYANNNSTIYRYSYEAETVAFSFTTNSIIDLNIVLPNAQGLTIDENNLLTLVDNVTGEFYRIDPFFTGGPKKVFQYNRSVFDVTATNITNLSADVNNNELVLIDEATNQIYRIDPDTGVENVAARFNYLTNIIDSILDPIGISVAQDGTLFILDNTVNILYNYNEFTDTNSNPGFIAKDLLISIAARKPSDFDLRWNQTCREDLSIFKSRVYIDAEEQLVTYLSKFLQEYNVTLYNHFLLYSLFQIKFDNFRSDGGSIREGDIKKDSFKPKKEWNQYFNSASCEYKNFPFSQETTKSETYTSTAGIATVRGEVKKELEQLSVYRRDDIDILMPLFVRLAAAEPEFIDVTVGFRFLFAQMNDFYNINFFDSECGTTITKSGRRFEEVPSFVRQIQLNLDTLEVTLKLWSLGSTAFGDYIPNGNPPGGEGDEIVLTTLGTPGFISPTGYINGDGINYITIEDDDGQDAESRTETTVGLAWAPGYKVALVNSATQVVEQILTIDTVSTSQINFVENIVPTITNTIQDSFGIIQSGYYIRYADYNDIISLQKTSFCYWGLPDATYPELTSLEVSEQTNGDHNFPDGRLPYLLHPFNYTSI